MIVVPREHVENVYEISELALGRVYAVAKGIAMRIRAAYGCEGTSMRQHNEPAGDQDVWHFHVHVFPRYPDDQLYRDTDRAAWVDAERRADFARRLRAHLERRS